MIMYKTTRYKKIIGCVDKAAATNNTQCRQNGASMTEFLIAAPLVLIIGMTSLQAALLYHGKTTLNYATFELSLIHI